MQARQALSLVTAAAIFASTAAPAFAIEAPAQKPAAPNSKAVTINPAFIKARVVRNNYGVMTQLNLIHQAKDTVEQARGRLLPSLNIGGVINTIIQGPAFAFSAISFLLPFLLPSNWANLFASEYLLASQKISYRLMQLNNTASAYSAYATVVSDMALREVLVTQLNDLIYIRDWLASQARFGGNVSPADLDNASAQVHLATANLASMDETLLRERAAVRQMLALDLSADLVFERGHVPESAGETLPLEKMVAKFQSIAPENQQIDYMIKAAIEDRWAKSFGFLTGGNLNVAINNGSPGFSQLSFGAGMNIGFDYCPTIDLASDKIQAIRIHARELLSQQQQLAESTLGSVAHAKTQVETTSTAEQELVRVARDEFQKYTLGASDLLHVFSAEKAVTEATAAKVKSQLDLDQLRITLHRELLSDQFASIPGCVLRRSAVERDRKHQENWLGKIFNPHDTSFVISIDEACAPAN